MSALRYRIATEIRAEIVAGVWQIGERLPSEPEIARRRSVSRETIRAAMTILEQQGYVERRRGSGTYATRRQPSNSDATTVMTLDLGDGADRERPTSTPSERPASVEIAEVLGIEVGAGVGEVRNVAIPGGHRVVDATSWWPLEYLAPSDVDGSIAASLASRGLPIEHSVIRLTPRNADGEIAARLDVPTGTLLLTVDEIARTEEGIAVLVTRAHHVAQAFEFTFVCRTSTQRNLTGRLAA